MTFWMVVYRKALWGVRSQLQRNVERRGYQTGFAHLTAHNFTMPAMSPTMTEGNISSWKIKEGDTFSAGDVLLEIETDKAQMDVEAQDDGVVAKITMGDGSKSVKVGSRIAVLADPEDDIQSLEIPPEEISSHQKEKKEAPAPSQSKNEDPKEKSADTDGNSSNGSRIAPRSSSRAVPRKQGTLLPSVLHLLKEKGLTKEDGDRIPASGPNGRLLKGDVLAYLGRIDESYSAEQSKRIEILGHLDLSNIKVASFAKKGAEGTDEGDATKADPATLLPEESRVDITLPISLAAVLSCQKRVEDTLGIYLPTSTFITRAVSIANEGLPSSPSTKPSADELFNAVLGLNDVVGPKLVNGNFMPQVAALPSSGFPYPKPRSSPAQPDIIDVLTGGKHPAAKAKLKATTLVAAGVGGAVNVFSLNVSKGQEKRAIVFLERVKTVLEMEPGTLIL